MCEAPSGPFRQNAPDPFSPTGGTSLSAAKGVVPTIYVAVSLAAIGLVQAAVRCGGPWTAVAMAWCGLAGLLILGALTLVNVVLLIQIAMRAARLGRGAGGT